MFLNMVDSGHHVYKYMMDSGHPVSKYLVDSGHPVSKYMVDSGHLPIFQIYCEHNVLTLNVDTELLNHVKATFFQFSDTL